MGLGEVRRICLLGGKEREEKFKNVIISEERDKGGLRVEMENWWQDSLCFYYIQERIYE